MHEVGDYLSWERAQQLLRCPGFESQIAKDLFRTTQHAGRGAELEKQPTLVGGVLAAPF